MQPFYKMPKGGHLTLHKIIQPHYFPHSELYAACSTLDFTTPVANAAFPRVKESGIKRNHLSSRQEKAM